MLKRISFKKLELKPELEYKNESTLVPCAPKELLLICPKCKETLLKSELVDNLDVCRECGYHFRISARKRIGITVDNETFVEYDRELKSKNMLNFPGYDEKLKTAIKENGENEAVICGIGKIEGFECAIFAMEPFFMMGSMGCVVGEKIARLFELAADKSIPVIGFTVSGGARMQEGIMSLMQMAKISGAVKRHSNNGNLYVAVLTDPTTGGVTASFAMQGDIIVSEPDTLIGFAGPRVIEQTIRRSLPDGFQKAKFLMEKGFIDNIVSRNELKKYLGNILMLHNMEAK